MIPCCCPLQVERCTIPSAAAFSATFNSQAGTRSVVPGGFKYTNFVGSGVDVTVTAIGDTLSISPGPQSTGNITIPASSQRTVAVTVAFSQPVYLRGFGIEDLDFGSNSEFAYNFDPDFNNVYGPKASFTAIQPAANPPTAPANQPSIRGITGNDIGGVLFNAPLVSALTFNIFHVAAAGSFLTELAFDRNNPFEVALFWLCPDGLTWWDANGNSADPSLLGPC